MLRSDFLIHLLHWYNKFRFLLLQLYGITYIYDVNVHHFTNKLWNVNSLLGRGVLNRLFDEVYLFIVFNAIHRNHSRWFIGNFDPNGKHFLVQKTILFFMLQFFKTSSLCKFSLINVTHVHSEDTHESTVGKCPRLTKITTNCTAAPIQTRKVYKWIWN